MDPVHTDRLLLRPLVRRDLRALHRLYSDPELMHYITGRPRTVWETRARLKKDLAHHRDFGFGLCLVQLAASGRIDRVAARVNAAAESPSKAVIGAAIHLVMTADAAPTETRAQQITARTEDLINQLNSEATH